MVTLFFQLSNVSSRIYHVASLIGLFPAQFVGVYVGSTLRSMQDVLENRHISSTTYFFATAQVSRFVLSIFRCYFFWNKSTPKPESNAIYEGNLSNRS